MQLLKNISIFAKFLRSVMKTPKNAIEVPEGLHKLLLHACCAPCSSAIVEWLLQHDIVPTIFYFNPNIYPLDEYLIRKNESQRQARSLGISWIDGDYNHSQWLQFISGLESEPERGRRCEQCFRYRLLAASQAAAQTNHSWFATTLASSRWKNLEQINAAGLWAEQQTQGTRFWAQNWRKGGLQQRRSELLHEYGFYNQQYCGCEFSFRQTNNKMPAQAGTECSLT